MHPRVKWSAAVYAGFAAGILATIVQIVLWSVFTDALPEIFFRDARFAAAIVIGMPVLAMQSRALGAMAAILVVPNAFSMIAHARREEMSSI